MKKSAEIHYNQGLALNARGHYSEAISAFEQALKAAPGDIQVLYALGHTAEALGMADAAERLYTQVLRQVPGQLEVTIALANLLRTRNRFHEAEKLLHLQKRITPDAPELWLTLGSARRESGDSVAARTCYEKALSLKPDYPAALGNMADMLADDGDFSKALCLYQSLLNLTPKDNRAKFSRALIYLSMGQCETGWQEYEARTALANAPVPNHNLPKWDGTFRPGLKLLLSLEQGLGDQLMFSGLIPEFAARAEAAGTRLLLACEPRLSRLLTRSLPQVRVIATHVTRRNGRNFADYQDLSELPALERPDCYQELGGLPRLVGLNQNSPRPGVFLKPDAAEVKRWRNWLQDMPRPWVGVCWRSGKLGGLRTRQYAPLTNWGIALKKMPGTLISVQYAATSEEITRLERLCGRKLQVPPDLDQKHEIDRTTAMLSALDWVVSAPTAVTWQAAGTGTRVARILEVPSWTQLGTSEERFSDFVSACVAPHPGKWAGAFATAQKKISTKKIGI